MTRIPAIFVSHGAPTLALDRERGARLTRWGQTLPRPTALLVVSAHWDRTPATLGATRALPLLHDYAGFPAELARLRYDAPPAPDLAERVRALLPGVAQAPDRPWDHGVWVPLLHLFPGADLPLLQLSLPGRQSPRELFALGRALAPLREEGVLVVGSGGAIHDLRRLDWSGAGGPAPWALAFENWLRDALARRDVDEVLDAETRSPGLRAAHPTLEHFQPLWVTLGAGADEARVTFPVEGWELGSLSHLGVQLG
ncbi:MAG: class III extradiol ring-cleavage dioxygenase [Planctomycetota bacterium]